MPVCANCENFINPRESSNPCPKCGSNNFKVNIQENIKVLEMYKLTEKKDGFIISEKKFGDKLSNKGNIAREYHEINRTNSKKTTKTHIVEELREDGNWELVHKEYEEFKAKKRPV